MEIINKLRSYLLEDEFAFHVYQNKVNVVNYTSIGEITSEKILIRYPHGTLIIKGNMLVVSRLLTDEVLIIGEIKNIELR